MEAMVQLVRQLKNEDGQALVEFGLILTFIAAVCIIAVTALGLAALVPLQDFMDGFGG